MIPSFGVTQESDMAVGDIFFRKIANSDRLQVDIIRRIVPPDCIH
jgi:hypothetical protein